MVFHDLSRHSISLKTQENAKIPPIQDRFLALVFDFILHAPLFYVITSWYFRKINMISYVTTSARESFLIWLQIVTIILISGVFLQAVYIKLMSATPGKKLLKIQVISVYGTSLTWGQVFLRSIMWWASLLFFCVPFLEVFSHRERRLLHDRAADTKSVSLKSVSETAPFELEANFVRSMLFTLAFSLLGIISAWLKSGEVAILSGKVFLEDYREKGLLCSAIDEWASHSRVKVETGEQRLNYALALYQLQSIDEECLTQEVDLAFMRGHSSLRFIGRILLSPKKSETQKTYIQQACDQGLEYCYLANLLTRKKNFYSYSESEQQAIIDLANQKYLFLSIFLADHFNNAGDYQKVADMLSKLEAQGIKSMGLVVENLKSQISQARWSEVEGALMASRWGFHREDYMQIAEKTCQMVMADSCRIQSSACRDFVKAQQDQIEWTGSQQMTWIEYAYCKRESSMLSRFSRNISNQETYALAKEVLGILNKTQSQQSYSALKRIAENEAKSWSHRSLALRVMINEFPNQKTAQSVFQVWKKASPGAEYFISLTHQLLKLTNNLNMQTEYNEIAKASKHLPFVANQAQPMLSSVKQNVERKPAQHHQEAP